MASTVAAVEFEQVNKRFGNVPAVVDVTLSIRPGEFFALLGPSGCGKTTLLRLIAGLEAPDGGRLTIHGADTADLPAHERSVNTVFQSYALFPHLNVYDNVAFGLRMKRVPAAALATRVARVMEMVQIAELRHRKPAELSGGQKQRVALARAIVNEPQVLLLDEPLGALDLKLRKQLQEELLGLQRRLGITFIYVTHDQEEALVLSDRIAVMNAGRLVQTGDAEDLYERPRTRFVSQFLGSASLLAATLVERTGTGALVDTPVGRLRVEFGAPPAPAAQRPTFTLAIRPEKIALREAGPAPTANWLPVTVREVIYVGSETHYLLAAGAVEFRAEMMNAKVGHQGFERGQAALAHFPPAGLMVLED